MTAHKILNVHPGKSMKRRPIFLKLILFVMTAGNVATILIFLGLVHSKHIFTTVEYNASRSVFHVHFSGVFNTAAATNPRKKELLETPMDSGVLSKRNMKLRELQNGLSALYSHFGNGTRNYWTIRWHILDQYRERSPFPAPCADFKAQAAAKRVVVPDVFKQDFNVDANDVTLVTHLDVERFGVLKLLIDAWECPLSLALYVSKNSTSAIMSAMKKQRRLLERDDVSLHLIEKVGDRYPNNHLMNIGIQNAHTHFVFLTDVDFIPNVGLCQHLRTVFTPGWNPQHVLVIPAFESRWRIQTNTSFPSTRSELSYVSRHFNVPKSRADMISGMMRGRYEQFHVSFTEGHKSTDYHKWLRTNETYKIQYGAGYEPYIICNRTAIPLYSEAFIGRGLNKIAHRLALYMHSFEFYVEKDYFIVHYPHPVSDDFSKSTKCTHDVYRHFVQDIKKQFPGKQLRVGEEHRRVTNIRSISSRKIDPRRLQELIEIRIKQQMKYRRRNKRP